MNEAIKTLIVDDEPKAVALFQKLLGEHKEIEVVATANGVDEAVDALLEFKPEMIFLDIQMPNKNGFELLHEIRDFDIQPTIIFVTAYDEYAIEAIRHSAFDYLTKPVDPRLLKKAILRYQTEKAKLNNRQTNENVLEHLKPSKVKFSTRTGTVFLELNDITHILAEGNYSEIFLRDGSTQMVSLNLARLTEKLPETLFFRTNRSTIINLNYLKKLDRKKKLCVLGVDGVQVELSIPTAYIRAIEGYIA